MPVEMDKGDGVIVLVFTLHIYCLCQAWMPSSTAYEAYAAHGWLKPGETYLPRSPGTASEHCSIAVPSSSF